MLLARGLRISVFILLALHLAGSFAAIGLLGRMGPALERIIARNVASLEAAEVMLAVLATQAGEPAQAPAAERFVAALDVARRNVTEEEEPRIIATIEELSEPALAADPAAVRSVIEAISELGALNRDAIEAADRDAQRLGFGGAWAVMFLSFVTLGAGLLALRQLERLVLAPMSELHAVITAAREGNALRRCRPSPGASAELVEAMHAINELSDELLVFKATRPKEVADDHATERATVLGLLDTFAEAAVVLDDQGEIVAANSRALERLAGDEGPSVRANLRAALVADGPVDIEASRIPHTNRVVCRVKETS